jgi:hypothetical protein
MSPQKVILLSNTVPQHVSLEVRQLSTKSLEPLFRLTLSVMSTAEPQDHLDHIGSFVGVHASADELNFANKPFHVGLVVQESGLLGHQRLLLEVHLELFESVRRQACDS